MLRLGTVPNIVLNIVPKLKTVKIPIFGNFFENAIFSILSLFFMKNGMFL